MKKTTKVLLVEDTQVVREMMSDLLPVFDSSLFVTSVDNGGDAIKCVLSDEFDIVLMDLRMAPMDGFETTAIIKETHPNLPIIAVTAFGSTKRVREKVEEVGFDDLLPKPTRDRQWYKLVSLIRKLVNTTKKSPIAKPELVTQRRKELENATRRLEILKERKALHGVDTPVSIIVQIEDTEAEIDGLREEIKECENG